ncbi:hypothetical protein [Halorussus salinisoli]|uniref:hypothetical protein n=1 Tax=Halorussus salinisoli TaxID=2558242 RepID=UPI00148555A5|nr:hypothetical protein [Halorussus salinisoli]
MMDVVDASRPASPRTQTRTGWIASSAVTVDIRKRGGVGSTRMADAEDSPVIVGARRGV